MKDFINSLFRYQPADPCGTLFLALLVAWVGHQAVAERERQRKLGGFAGAVVFCAFVFAGLRREEPLAAAVHAACVAGFTLGLCWLALAAVAACAEKWKHLGEEWQRRASERRKRAEERAQQRQREEETCRRQRDETQAEPERQRLRAESEARELANAEARRRREDARAACEILYALHAPEIGPRFSREMFDDFLKRHLGDDRSADYVEQRAQQLRQVIEQHLRKVGPSDVDSTIAAAVTAHNLEVERVKAMGLSEEMQGTLLALMEAQLYERLQRRMEGT